MASLLPVASQTPVRVVKPVAAGAPVELRFGADDQVVLSGEPGALLRILDEVRAQIAGSARPTVHVLVVRDPDSGTDVNVYVDGLPVDATQLNVDPGAGALLSEWFARTNLVAGDESLPQPLRDAFVEAMDSYGFEYVEDDLECGHDREHVRFIGEDALFAECTICAQHAT